MEKDIHDIVRRDYANIALEKKENSIVNDRKENQVVSATVGYTPEELALAPEGANMGLGCGNPHRKAAIQPGEIVLDLGSGTGLFYCGKDSWKKRTCHWCGHDTGDAFKSQKYCKGKPDTKCRISPGRD